MNFVKVFGILDRDFALRPRFDPHKLLMFLFRHAVFVSFVVQFESITELE
jgi:hypothetical protein